MSDATDAAMQSWESDVKQTNTLYDQLQTQKDRLNDLLALMGQVPASVAFNMLIPAAMLMVSNQNNSEMEIQASQGNEEADVLTLINITQSDDNYLASNSGAYQDYENSIIYYNATQQVYYHNGSNGLYVYKDPLGAGQDPYGTGYYLVANPVGSSSTTNPYIYDASTGQPVLDSSGQPLTWNENNATMNDPDNQAMAQEYEDTYAEAQEAQSDLQTIFDYSNPDDPSYNDPIYGGWCDENYASSMLAAYKSWQSATDDLSAQGTDDPAGESDEYYYSEHLQQYSEDPASSPYATDVTNLTTSLNTEQSANNSMQSQIQGIIKALMSEAQQYEGSTKSAGKSVIEEKNYWVQQQRSS